jgi:DNA recombination protein RmuC
LSSRQYWEALSPSPELVVMFLPSESLLSAALQDDPNLIEFSVTRQVILSSPLTLVTLLKAVAYGWRQVEVQNNAEQIRQLGQELYSRIRVMAEHFQDVGQKLQSSVNSYNRTIGSLEHKVLSGARKFVDLGAATKEQPVPALAAVEVLPRVLAAEELKPARTKGDSGQRDLLRSVGG